MSRTKHSIFIDLTGICWKAHIHLISSHVISISITYMQGILALLLLSSFIIAKNLSKKSSFRSEKSHKINGFFEPSCGEVSFGQNKLVVKCNGNYKEVNLDQKLENNDGKLQFKNNGNYSRSWKDCSLNTEEIFEMKTYELRCECKDRRQRYRHTSINVDSLVDWIINMN